MKKQKITSVAPSLFEEFVEKPKFKQSAKKETSEFKKIEVSKKTVEQTLFDVPVHSDSAKRKVVRTAEKMAAITNAVKVEDTPCFKALFPFNHDNFGINACYHRGESVVKNCGNKIRQTDNSYNKENYHKQ